MIIAATTPSRRFAGRFLKEIEALFVQVLELAREMGLLKLGTVALDDTKMHWRSARLPAVWGWRAGAEVHLHIGPLQKPFSAAC